MKSLKLLILIVILSSCYDEDDNPDTINSDIEQLLDDTTHLDLRLNLNLAEHSNQYFYIDLNLDNKSNLMIQSVYDPVRWVHYIFIEPLDSLQISYNDVRPLLPFSNEVISLVRTRDINEPYFDDNSVWTDSKLWLAYKSKTQVLTPEPSLLNNYIVIPVLYKNEKAWFSLQLITDETQLDYIQIQLDKAVFP